MGQRERTGTKADFEGMKRTAAKYVFAAKYTHGKACLDLACGSGYGSAYVVSKGSPLVIGGDISPGNIATARASYLRERTEFLILDAQSLPFGSGSFDVVISIETIEHLGKPGEFLQECNRVLRKGGILILSTPGKQMASPYTVKPAERNKGFQSHVREFEPDELLALTRKYFPDVAAYGQFYAKDATWRFDTLTGSFVSPVMRALPGGERLIYLLRHFVLRRPYVTMRDLSELMADGAIADDVLPFPQEGKETGCIIAVARK